MGKATGFLETERRENPWREPRSRLGDFLEMHLPLSISQRMAQASRCMNCGVPFCQSDFGCPLHNLIPEWNDLLCQGCERQALDRLLKTAPFPEFTGRVCPALCEKACMMAETDGATANRDNELYLIEKGFSENWVVPKPPEKRSGRQVAVVGSGPAGLAAAQSLNRLGHSVTVFEKSDQPGGLLMYGIPNMKLPKEIISRRIRLMEQEGIRFLTSTQAGPDLTDDFDAVILCGGARKPRGLQVPGADAEGVCFAVDYLTQATRGVLSGTESLLSARDLDVIVVGGGDTGNDCVGTALRQGCRSLMELELLPAPPCNRRADNPWPLWPRVFRTDYGQEEAGSVYGQDPRLFETTVTQVHLNPAGRIEAVTLAKVENEQGRLSPVAGTERTVPCQLLLIAAGFIGCDPDTAAAFGLTLNRRGLPVAETGHRISDRLFAAGDMLTGQSLVVRAMADGCRAAEEVHSALSSSLP